MTEPTTVFQAIAAVASLRPDSPALSGAEGRAIAYAGLLQRCHQVEGWLKQAGIGRGNRVALALPHGPAAAVTTLGVMACATAIPLDPHLTQAEFEARLAMLRPRAVLVTADPASAARRAAERLRIPTIEWIPSNDGAGDAFELRVAAASAGERPSSPAADDVALVLLTSGATSRPKAVPIRHRGLLTCVRNIGSFLELRPTDVCFNPMPLFHGHGLLSGMLAPLVSGGSTICVPAFDADRAIDQIEQLGPTWFTASFTFHHALLAAARRRGRPCRHRLRFIRSGSGVLDPSVVRELESIFGVPMVLSLSMSEAGMIAATPPHLGERPEGTLGRPLKDGVAILGESGRLLGPGELGEIVARGPNVFQGYEDDPVANAAAFHQGWFRTGDLGLINHEGNLVFRGRLKEMINRGGEKIAPVEIDAVLREHSEVDDAAAFGLAHSSLGEEVAAAVVRKDGASVTEDGLIRFTRRHLAHFKIPRRIVFLDALPRTATGKLVRHELTRRFQLEARQAPHRAVEIADRPSSSLETTLAKLWADTLGIERVGVDEDFFLLGGDSLQAVSLLADVRAVCGVELPIKSMFDDTPTVAGMARTIDSLRDTSKSGQNGAARASSVLPIRAHGELAPVFAVGGSGGHSVGFAHLAARLRPDHPFYGLDARGLDGRESPLTRIEDIASEHIRQMRRVRATGPYVLIGACFGGRVVFEMAQQLDGEAALVVLLDPSEPFKGLRFAPDTADDRTGGFVRERLALYASELRRTPARSRPRYVWEKLAVFWGMIRARDPYRGDRSEYHRREVWRANKLAGRRYIAKPYRGPVAVFWTRERDGHEKRHRAEWATVIQNPVTTAFVPGRDSGEMLHAAHVGALAPHIDGCLHDMHTATTGEGSPVIR